MVNANQYMFPTLAYVPEQNELESRSEFLKTISNRTGIIHVDFMTFQEAFVGIPEGEYEKKIFALNGKLYTTKYNAIIMGGIFNPDPDELTDFLKKEFDYESHKVAPFGLQAGILALKDLRKPGRINENTPVVVYSRLRDDRVLRLTPKHCTVCFIRKSLDDLSEHLQYALLNRS